jgi:hypothetical protein
MYFQQYECTYHPLKQFEPFLTHSFFLLVQDCKYILFWVMNTRLYFGVILTSAAPWRLQVQLPALEPRLDNV